MIGGILIIMISHGWETGGFGGGGLVLGTTGIVMVTYVVALLT